MESGKGKVEGKNVLVTGGAGGIGRLLGLDFAQRGARFLIWDLNREAIGELEELGRERGLFIRGMVCDISDRNDVYRQAAALLAEFGPLDILVNNAGVVSGKTLLNTPDEKIIQTMNINTLSLFWTAKAFLPSMLERNRGRIVTISSAAGLIGVPGLADYCASKFAAFGFDEALRMELGRLKSGVKTTVICPFYIDTGMFEGVKTKFPLLLPILKKEYAAKRIVRAILSGRQRLVIPPFAYMVFLLRLFPTAVLDWAAWFFGINHSMDEFRGRGGSHE
jgi:all-trans-retinol dehydrogenase (NAD+)